VIGYVIGLPAEFGNFDSNSVACANTYTDLAFYRLYNTFIRTNAEVKEK